MRGGDRGEKWRRRIEEEDGMVRRQRFVANRSQTMGKKVKSARGNFHHDL